MASKYSQIDPKQYDFIKKSVQYIIVAITNIYFKIFFRAEFHGRENVPEDGAYIVASTHSSYFDPFIVCLATKRSVAFMAKEELFHVPVLSQAIQVLGAFAVNRGKLEVSTIKSAKNILTKTNWLLGIFPEGTRVRGNKIGKINPGFGYLAKSTKTKVLPVGIHFERPICPLFGKLVVKIGPLIELTEKPEELLDKWGESISELTGFAYDKEDSLGAEETSASV
jgi:1-acyl-sn-glycerol-3-phosphate acyltransferase